MKKGFKIGLLLLIVPLLSGCVKNYSRKDIIKYVKNELGIRKIDVSQNFIVSEDTSGYKDEVWTVTDKVNNITFHVRNNKYYSMEMVSNRLDDDYSSILYMKFKDYLKTIENITETDKNDSNGVNSIELNCNYDSSSKLRLCINSLINIKQYYEKMNSKFDLDFNVDYKSDKGNEKHLKPHGYGSTSTINEERIEDLYNKYYRYGFEYQISDIMDDVSKTDKEKMFNSDGVYRLYKLNNNKIDKVYENVVSSTTSIVVEGLYQLLKEEGLNPVGTPENYTVYNSLGDKFEFSTKFNDYPVSNGSMDSYYIKNGEKFRLYFGEIYVGHLYDLFGINIVSVDNKFYNHYFDQDGNYKKE